MQRIYPPREKICKLGWWFQNDTTKTWTAHVQDLPAGTTPTSVYRVRSVPLARPSLPDIAHYRWHGIDRITAWCLSPFCSHQGTVTFEELAAHGAGETTKLLAVKLRLKCTKCGGQHADLQPDWSQRSAGAHG